MFFTVGRCSVYCIVYIYTPSVDTGVWRTLHILTHPCICLYTAPACGHNLTVYAKAAVVMVTGNLYKECKTNDLTTVLLLFVLDSGIHLRTKLNKIHS